MNIYYVYAYINSKTGLPYYIGKGKENRAFKKHDYVSVPNDKSKIVFLETNLTELGALALERRMIRWYGRKIEGGILLNLLEGGDMPPSRKGKKQSKASIKKAIATKIIRGNTGKGRIKSKEEIEKSNATKFARGTNKRSKESIAKGFKTALENGAFEKMNSREAKLKAWATRRLNQQKNLQLLQHTQQTNQ